MKKISRSILFPKDLCEQVDQLAEKETDGNFGMIVRRLVREAIEARHSVIQSEV